MIVNPRALSAMVFDSVYRPLLQQVCERWADLSLEEMVESIKHEEDHLWALVDKSAEIHGCLVTRVVKYATGYEVMLVHTAATTKGWNSTPEDMRRVVYCLEHIAEALGCDAIRIVGRPGWSKILTDFKEVQRVFDKPLKEN